MWNRSFFVVCVLVVDFSALLVRSSDQASRFIFHPGPITWSNAQEHCRKYYQDLVTFTNKDDTTRALKMCRTTAGCWIGLFRAEDDKNVWNWSGGEKFNFTMWWHNQPNNLNHQQDCVVMRSGYWNDLSCQNKRAFLCHKNDLIFVKENKTWEDALEHCRNLSMGPKAEDSDSSYLYDLASINIANCDARTMIQYAQTQEAWIGLRFLAGHWVLVSEPKRSPTIPLWMHINEMYGKLPDCPKPGMDCGAISKESMHVKLKNCEEKKNFFCLKSN